jgi:hypothetical protein
MSPPPPKKKPLKPWGKYFKYKLSTIHSPMCLLQMGECKSCGFKALIFNIYSIDFELTKHHFIQKDSVFSVFLNVFFNDSSFYGEGLFEASHDAYPCQSMDQKVGLPYPKNRPLIDLNDENPIRNNHNAPPPVLPVIVTDRTRSRTVY